MGPGQYPQYTDAAKTEGRGVAQKHHRRLDDKDSHTDMVAEPFVATTELDDRTRNQSFPGAETFRNQPRATGSPAGSPLTGSAGELREARRQHVQSDHDAEFDGAGYQEVGLG